MYFAPKQRAWRPADGALAGGTRRVPAAMCPIAMILLGAIIAPAAQAQVRISGQNAQFEFSDTVQLDRADGVALAHLERAKACLAAHQWDEAVETLRQVMENAEGKLLAVTPWHYVNLSDACQMRLAAMPPEALSLYRRRVDPVAQKWCEEGIVHRDAKLLQNVVQQAFASSWGDKALMALGEIRLEEGDFSAARWCWERILPAKTPPGEESTWPGYPDSTLDPAAVRARLVLVSILEGSPRRAREELSAMVRLHADARGRFGGREVTYVAALAELLNQSSLWPKEKRGADWPTFAGSPSRNTIAPALVDVAGIQWRATLRRPPFSLPSSVEPHGAPVAENPLEPLAFYPVISGRRVFAADQGEIFGFLAESGRPAWGDSGASIYREPADLSSPGPALGETLGVPRFTLTIADGRLYARIGSPVTSSPQPGVSQSAGSIVCLDLRAEGKLLWRINAEEGWAFDGAPVAAGAKLLVAMRRGDIHPQLHVACFETTTGRMRWRRFVCAAETPARGTLAECTHTLLTLTGGAIYVNTNLGAVASLAMEDGRVNWLSLYPRARSGNLLHMDPHWHRDLNPCLVDRGRLYVAPADSPRIYALDAATGQILWPGRRDDRPADSPIQDPLDDVVHLLGVAGEYLIAGGHRLYWIESDGPRAGNIAHVWPEGNERLGYGRGVLAGDDVLWPTRDKIYVFQQQTARLKREIDLAPLGLRGGNLLVVDGRLLIATPSGLVVLASQAGKKKEQPAEITATGKIRNPNCETNPRQETHPDAPRQRPRSRSET